jgi:hypothetical protein
MRAVARLVPIYLPGGDGDLLLWTAIAVFQSPARLPGR